MLFTALSARAWQNHYKTSIIITFSIGSILYQEITLIKTHTSVLINSYNYLIDLQPI